ncbi:Mitochondrial import inner membrane translocase subunit TIM10 [Glycine soja]
MFTLSKLSLAVLLPLHVLKNLLRFQAFKFEKIVSMRMELNGFPKSISRNFQGTMASNISPAAFDKEQVGILFSSSNFGKTDLVVDVIFGMAEKEMEYRVELFNKMTQTCFKKCVDNRYKESELNMGENSCIDRCVSKYWHVTNLVGQLLGSGRPPM